MSGYLGKSKQHIEYIDLFLILFNTSYFQSFDNVHNYFPSINPTLSFVTKIILWAITEINDHLQQTI